MKLFIATIGLLTMVSCSTQKQIITANPTEYASSITSTELKEHLYTFASDEFMGRETGKPGQKKAANYLKKAYMALEIASPLGENEYYQPIPSSYFNDRFGDTENVIAFIK